MHLSSSENFHSVRISPGVNNSPVASNTKIETAKTFLARMDQRLAELGKTRYWLSKEVTDPPRGNVFNGIDQKLNVPGSDRLAKIAEALNVTTDWLVGVTNTPDPVMSEVSFQDLKRDWIPERPTNERGIPLVGTGDCAELTVLDEDGHEIEVERSSFDPEYHVRYIKRPSVLTGDRKAYAIYFHGSSMEPRFFAGEIGIVQPDRHAGPGDYVLAQINDGTEDHVVSVLVKRLVRQTSQFYELEQYNPPAVFRLPKRQVTHLHRIMLPNELLG